MLAYMCIAALYIHLRDTSLYTTHPSTSRISLHFISIYNIPTPCASGGASGRPATVTPTGLGFSSLRGIGGGVVGCWQVEIKGTVLTLPYSTDLTVLTLQYSLSLVGLGVVLLGAGRWRSKGPRASPTLWSPKTSSTLRSVLPTAPPELPLIMSASSYCIVIMLVPKFLCCCTLHIFT